MLFMRNEIINPLSTNYVVITAFVDGKYVSSVYALTEDGEFQGFITNERKTNRESTAKRNHEYFCLLYDDSKKEKPHTCDYCGDPYAEKSEFLTRKNAVIKQSKIDAGQVFDENEYGDVYLCHACHTLALERV